MAKLTFNLYDKEYTVTCNEGEQERLGDIIKFVEKRMGDVAGRAGNTTESRLLMLTCLHLADELLDARRKAEIATIENEELMVKAVDHLNQRIAHIATQVGRA